MAGVRFIGGSRALTKRVGVGLDEPTLHIIQAIQMADTSIQAFYTLTTVSIDN